MHRLMVRSHNRRLLLLAAAVCPLAVGCSLSLADSKPEVLRYCRVAVSSSDTGTPREAPVPPDGRDHHQGDRVSPDRQAGSTTMTPCIP